MITLLKSLDIHDENLNKRLTERILNKQEENGAWKLWMMKEQEIFRLN